jgi:carbonic anhydrase/acetyltransferase-like protein (isoleucine patch superfamily)
MALPRKSRIKERLWVAPDAHVIGDVTLGLDVGIWFGSVLRGDNDPLVDRRRGPTSRKAR